jgi:hypothetical protein
MKIYNRDFFLNPVYHVAHLPREMDVLPSAVIVYLENIGFVYPAMSMMVMGPSLLY